MTNNKISPQVEALVQSLSKYQTKVDQETIRHGRLEQEKEDMTREVRERQDVLQGLGQTRLDQHTQNYISTLENRLQTVLSLLHCYNYHFIFIYSYNYIFLMIILISLLIVQFVGFV